jgi:hypothetical protein
MTRCALRFPLKKANCGILDKCRGKPCAQAKIRTKSREEGPCAVSAAGSGTASRYRPQRQPLPLTRSTLWTPAPRRRLHRLHRPIKPHVIPVRLDRPDLADRPLRRRKLWGLASSLRSSVPPLRHRYSLASFIFLLPSSSAAHSGTASTGLALDVFSSRRSTASAGHLTVPPQAKTKRSTTPNVGRAGARTLSHEPAENAENSTWKRPTPRLGGVWGGAPMAKQNLPY